MIILLQIIISAAKNVALRHFKRHGKEKFHIGMRCAFNLRPVFIEYFFGGKPATELSGGNYFNIFSRRKLIFLAELIFSVTLCARRHGKIRLVTDITER